MKAVTPILDEKLSTDILNATVMFSKKTMWKALGMHNLREQGAALLFHGLPGTGKTVTARHLCKQLGLVMQEMDFGMIGSDTPGELARNIKKLFAQAAVLDKNDNPSMVFLDECDTMLISRAKLGHSSMWMLEPINALLREIGQYAGLVVLATNQRPDFLDPALERRLIGSFYFGKPEFLTRVKLWKDKWPKTRAFSKALDITQQQYTLQEAWDTLARYELTGAEIELMIIKWVSNALRREASFSIKDLMDLVRTEHNDRIPTLPFPEALPNPERWAKAMEEVV